MDRPKYSKSAGSLIGKTGDLSTETTTASTARTRYTTSLRAAKRHGATLLSDDEPAVTTHDISDNDRPLACNAPARQVRCLTGAKNETRYAGRCSGARAGW